MQGIRGYLAPLIGGPLGQREMKAVAARLESSGGVATGLVGAGGEADEKARAER